jgi:hypothetical protein
LISKNSLTILSATKALYLLIPQRVNGIDSTRAHRR